MVSLTKILMAEQNAKAKHCPVEQSDDSDNLLAIVAADRAIPVLVVERYRSYLNRCHAPEAGEE